MQTYIMFGRYSSEAIKGASRTRTDEAAALVGQYGGRVNAAYALLGKTDLLLIADFPSIAAAMKASMALTKLTGIAFSTSPAVTIEELDKLLGEL